MLDSAIKEQLKTVFAGLDQNISLVIESSSHADQSELEDLLNGLAETSAHISLVRDSKKSEVPAFRIEREGQKTGIEFRGIPGGHEFSSLVLAILNVNGKGKLPDPAIQSRIRKLKGPIRLKTYVSLSCENCPDVVQALNQMALLHPDFHHQMVDGAYVQDEVTRLNIQGVPSVVANDSLVHSGRITFLDLLVKLENHFGQQEDLSSASPTHLGEFDVVVLGGGPAGVSAAIYSVRKGLKTALIAERIGGQVQDTKGIENLISVVYTEGPQLSAQLYEHLKSYPVTVLEHRRVKAINKGLTQQILLDSGEELTAKQLIVTTGAKWRELNIPGEKEYLGRGVAYCPHCDGPFYKGKKVAVVGGGNSGVEAAIDLAGIVREVVLIEFNDQLKADQILVNKLKSLPNVSILTGRRSTQVLGDGQKVAGIELENRQSKELERVDLDGIFVQIGLLPNSQFLKGVVELSPYGEVIVDQKGRTSTPGIYAAGDVTTTPYKQIIIAMGEGAKVSLAAFEDRMKAT